MKAFYYVCTIACAMLFNNAAQAYYDSPGGGLSIGINDSKITTTDSYTKYAAVSFISKKGITTSGASQGDDLDSAPIKETSCPKGETKVNGICIDVSACETSFPLPAASRSVGSYVTKNCGNGNRFCYTSCQTGWVKEGCKCTAVSCSGFPHGESSGHNCDGVKSCKTGDTYKYKCTSCQDGYTLSDGQCSSKVCTDHGKTYFSSITEHCKSYDVKRTGDKECFKCTECNKADGWVLDVDTGRCKERGCDDGYASSPVAHCIKNDTHKNGTGFCYKCTGCDDSDGWTLSNGKCVPKTCSNKSAQVTDCVDYSSIFKSGDGYCYTCKTCADGYKLSNGQCVAKTCGTTPSDDLKGVTKESGIINCAEPIYLGKAGTKKCYRCQKCAAGYKLVGGGLDCQAMTCGIGANYDLQGTYDAIKGCIDFSTNAPAGTGLCRQCAKCAPGYTNNGSPNTQCAAKTCGIGSQFTVQGTTEAITNCAEFETIAATGDNICKKCKTCSAGYVTPKGAPAGVTCAAATCGPSAANTYMGSASPISHCKTYQDTGMTPSGMCRKCTACEDGYKSTGGGMACEAKTCGLFGSYDISGTTSKISNCAEYSTIAKAGESICYRCKTCNNGYHLYMENCEANTCGIGAGKTIQGTPNLVANCTSYATAAPAGTGMCYKCSACTAGYTLNSTGTSCDAAACSGYDLTSCPANGSCSTCQSGSTPKYKLDSCASGYTKSGNSCITTCTEAEYPFVISTMSNGLELLDGTNIDGLCSTRDTCETPNGTKRYKCTACKGNAYQLTNGRCVRIPSRCSIGDVYYDDGTCYNGHVQHENHGHMVGVVVGTSIYNGSFNSITVLQRSYAQDNASYDSAYHTCLSGGIGGYNRGIGISSLPSGNTMAGFGHTIKNNLEAIQNGLRNVAGPSSASELNRGFWLYSAANANSVQGFIWTTTGAQSVTKAHTVAGAWCVVTVPYDPNGTVIQPTDDIGLDIDTDFTPKGDLTLNPKCDNPATGRNEDGSLCLKLNPDL